MASLLDDDDGATGAMGMGMGDEPAGPVTAKNPHYVDLIDVWRCEVACPEVLEWRGDLVDGLLGNVEQQERMIEGTLANAADAEECLFSAPMYQTELARVRFVLGAYVRARLVKIEAQAGHIAADPAAFGRLSDREQAHCEQYLALLHKHHRAALLSDLPQPFADEADGDACPAALGKAASEAPKLGRFVFARAKRDIGDVEIDPSGETAYFEKDDVHVLRYEGVQSLVHTGDLALI